MASQINIPQKDRIKRLVDDYAAADKNAIAAALESIKKRIGGLVYQQCKEALANGDYSKGAELTLYYYDKAYNHGLSTRKPDSIQQLFFDEDIPEITAKKVIEFVENN